VVTENPSAERYIYPNSQRTIHMTNDNGNGNGRYNAIIEGISHEDGKGYLLANIPELQNPFSAVRFKDELGRRYKLVGRIAAKEDVYSEVKMYSGRRPFVQSSALEISVLSLIGKGLDENGNERRTPIIEEPHIIVMNDGRIYKRQDIPNPEEYQGTKLEKRVYAANELLDEYANLQPA